MAGYNWSAGKSNNAVDAESNGRYPLTRAAKILAAKIGISQAHAKELLKAIGTTEYHHTSKFFNAVDYYDISDAWIEENREEIECFEYEPAQKKPRRRYLKADNSLDPRHQSWKITSRDGRHCELIDQYQVDSLRAYLAGYERREKPTHKGELKRLNADIETLREQLAACELELIKTQKGGNQ